MSVLPLCCHCWPKANFAKSLPTRLATFLKQYLKILSKSVHLIVDQHWLYSNLWPKVDEVCVLVSCYCRWQKDKIFKWNKFQLSLHCLHQYLMILSKDRHHFIDLLCLYSNPRHRVDEVSVLPLCYHHLPKNWIFEQNYTSHWAHISLNNFLMIGHLIVDWLEFVSANA